MDRTDAQRTASDQADMLRYFTDSEAFRKENEQLDARIVALRNQYDAKIDTIRPALQDLMDRPVAFKVQTLHLVLPSTFKRLVNLVATALTAGMNFMRGCGQCGRPCARQSWTFSSCTARYWKCGR